jgi:hypothetical protein
VRAKHIPNAVKYPQVAGHCICEIQRDSLSAGVDVEGVKMNLMLETQFCIQSLIVCYLLV